MNLNKWWKRGQTGRKIKNKSENIFYNNNFSFLAFLEDPISIIKAYATGTGFLGTSFSSKPICSFLFFVVKSRDVQKMRFTKEIPLQPVPHYRFFYKSIPDFGHDFSY